MTYKFFKGTSDEVQTNCILRKTDNALIPFDETNTDYQAYLAWVAEGNTAEAADQTVNKLTTRT